MIESLINKFKKPSESQELILNINQMNRDEPILSVSVLINSKESGNIYCFEDVIVDLDAEINGDIFAKSCRVSGKVIGNILCSEYIEIESTSIVEGNVKSKSIEIRPGSIVNGFISIDKKISIASIKEKIDEELSRNDNGIVKHLARPAISPEIEKTIDHSDNPAAECLTESSSSVDIIEPQGEDFSKLEKPKVLSADIEIDNTRQKAENKAAPLPSSDSWW